MTTFEIDEDVLQALLEEIGEKLRQVVQATAEDTVDQCLDSAADLLQERLATLDGVELDRGWSVDALETLRRGDELTIELG
jgi:hypothetical protein